MVVIDNDEKIKLRHRFEQAGQGHVFQYLPTDTTDTTTTDTDIENFWNQIKDINVEELGKIFASAMAESSSTATATATVITPFSKPVGSTKKSNDNIQEWYKIGMNAIRQGTVAALVLAGGQGTRLGYDGPKGMYDIGLPSHRTLFQLLCERLLKLKQLAAVATATDATTDIESSSVSVSLPSLPFYIMTSPINHDATVQYLQSNSYFGLPPNDVICFQQGMLPCLDNDGKIILETSTKIAMAPDGNGGIYPSLQKSGLLDQMISQRNIQHLHVFSIDNSLTKPADPVFLGYCISQKASCGNKVVWKVNAHEKVGVLAEKNNKPCIVEYSEITKEMAERTTIVTKDDGDGEQEQKLVFGAGNICNHYYTLDFLKDTVLPNFGDMYHVARKKIPYYDPTTKQTVTPTLDNNGIKLESFIFDVFPLCCQDEQTGNGHIMAVLDVLREEEFAPVKNAPGSNSDSPDTARQYISNQAKRWVQAAGGILIEKNNNTDNDNDDAIICEVSPLTSYAGEGLEDLVAGKEITCPFYLENGNNKKQKTTT